ncbi:probable protein phosphatase 2C 33 [Ipomoea triloba]|uniref:probable protein phosphatase 2C 33 n=1 Tax=Ipomoea triloba TaxID=35885 RepID=UPI00125DB704|nr:probable protein phosphatase 2C 33 [Ipomoea triloba]
MSAFGIRKRRSSEQSPGSQNSPFDYRKKERLHRIPGRLYLNGSSEVASLFTQQGKKGPNQDAMIVWENFGSRRDTVFCGVFDGHGSHGHMVAKRVRDDLPLKLSAHWEVRVKTEDVLLRGTSVNTSGINSEDAPFIYADEEPRASIGVEEIEKYPDIFQTVKESFLKAFKVMDRELKTYTNINSNYSGTTAVTLLKQGQNLVIANVGDSRAVLGTRDNEDNSLTAVQLTVDLKPNLPVEAERIRKCKGRVFALREEPEVARVWLPKTNFPGLAMSRALGDFCLKSFGVISVPEVSYRRLTEKDEFIVLATDGIWDVLCNEEVVKIVASAPTRSSAAKTLVEAAVRGWNTKYPTSRTDDCAVVCLFLKAFSVGENEVNNGKVDASTTPAEMNGSDALGNDENALGTESNKEQGKDWSSL